MLTADAGAGADPVLVEIVQGSLASVEMEVETAIGRTSRSPMIRDAHDFRAGIHDRLLRKLTGRSYSALVHPVARDFPIEEMQEGDVFFHNDVYRSEGGIGHLPDLCVTVPVLAGPSTERRVVAFVQAFGHHDDIGGAVPGSMPSHATSVFEEGLMVPPIRLWDAGVPNKAALAIMTRNSRMPESLAADLDAECSACLMGARRLGELFDRYGVDTVESCFDAIIDRTTTTYRREILSQIPVGEWVWEDYAEHDGVEVPKLHTQRISMTRTPADDPDGERLILDFAGTGPQARGPINHCGNYSDGVFLKKWLAPILRNLAESPERMAELDVNEGIVPLIEMRFPPPGTLLTPVFPAPTNARTFVILRLLGVLAGVVAKAVDGRMPADQETIRYTGVYGEDLDGRPYLMREVLGGGSGGRYYADGEDTIHVVPDSRNLPSEFTESRFPLRVESLGLATDSGGAGQFRGGLGYEKHIRMLKDGHFMSIADRSILACWGVKGGLAGKPFEVVIDPGGPNERAVDALADDEPVRAGEVIRIRTTGGGGWGNPLERDPHLVVRDVVWRKVSPEAAIDGVRRRAHRLACGRLARVRRGRDRGREGRQTGRLRGVLRPRTGLRASLRRGDVRRGRPAMRVLFALGGNAMTNPDGRARPEDQIAAARIAAESVAEVVAQGVDVLITHGNGPQVGNLLVKNEIAAAVVPPVPLDWCGAQTQATLGFVLMNALDDALRARGVERPTATVVTRTLVALDDPGFSHPTKPIGRHLPQAEAQVLVEHGETWEDRGEKGWRRMVASPEPLEIVDAPAIGALVDSGFVVIANGGGGIPVVFREEGFLDGVEAVIDKDLGAALLADTVGVDVLVIVTDVPQAVLHFGTPDATPIGRVTVTELRRLATEGHFASGSMGPKVDAACRFVERGGTRAVITSLSNIVDAVPGNLGTVVLPEPPPPSNNPPSSHPTETTPGVQ